MKPHALVLAGALLLVAGVATEGWAQVSLPVPQLPVLRSLPNDAKQALPNVRETLGEISELRKQVVRDLVRRNPRTLERLPNDAVAIRHEVVAWSPSPEALARARSAGFTIARRTELEGLDAAIVVLRAPSGMSTRRALARLREADPDGAYDYNHLYQRSGPFPRSRLTTATSVKGRCAAAGARIGLIDGGVDASHPALAGAAINGRGFSGPITLDAHATAIASLIVGSADAFVGAAPDARLFAADVYGGAPTGGAADAIAQALAWMARERVSVINVSLVGPPNRTLELAIRAARARGALIVAAVGNDGPAAPPLYPAAYEGVIGVTGVNARRRVLLEAGRGPQVDFAAPGADMAAARLGGGFTSVYGTSYAAPIVTGLLATAPASSAESALAAEAIDLGARGRDQSYGAGLVGERVRVAPDSLPRSVSDRR